MWTNFEVDELSASTPLIIMLKQMDEYLKSISPMNLEIQRKKVEKFHEIINNKDASYLQDVYISPEYLMTLLAPIGTKIIVKIMGGLENFPKVAGVIHTSSELNYFQPIPYGSYFVSIRAERLQKKTGKTGDYYAFTFRMSLINENDVEIANDIHQFFLKLREDSD
ncbi:MAG: hypothetical protein ACTSQ8_04300 [Candidatus Helarchaeota archaeon]